ncbi:MAG TPA: cysteine peptidase family C39 domain-containing protein [Blastocatellia bacterium]|nr:cysteine peptidase family C39 domain-containing protein [Blastocatellia bacterium]
MDTLTDVPKKTPQHLPRAKGKAKGWFFHEVETILTTPHGVVLGQMYADSCVAACARMLAADAGVDVPESYLRDLLKIDEGGYLSDLPAALQTIGVSTRYEYRRDLTLAALQQAVQTNAAVAYLEKPMAGGHAVVVETITEMFVTVRDPLPIGEGRGYQVRQQDFLQFWLLPNSDRGRALIVVE